MMHLVGLNGLNLWPLSMLISGRIDIFFESGYFPYRWNWRAKHAKALMEEIRFDKYILTGFSDGGTLAYRLAHLDDRCQGLMVHSGLFPKVPLRKSLPILLLITQGDRTPTAQATQEAYDWYNSKGYDVTMVSVPGKTWMRHEYESGIPFMQLWCYAKFRYDLPVRNDRDKIYD